MEKHPIFNIFYCRDHKRLNRTKPRCDLVDHRMTQRPSLLVLRNHSWLKRTFSLKRFYITSRTRFSRNRLCLGQNGYRSIDLDELYPAIYLSAESDPAVVSSDFWNVRELDEFREMSRKQRGASFPLSLAALGGCVSINYYQEETPSIK